MIICYINKKQAYPAQSDIKITLQNPFIKDGDDKTMEVVFPMDIPENRDTTISTASSILMSLFFIVAPPKTTLSGKMITVLLTCVKDSTMRKVKKVLRFGYNITTRSSKLQDPIAKKFQKISILLQARPFSPPPFRTRRGRSALRPCGFSRFVRFIGRRTGGNVPTGSQLFYSLFEKL